MNNLTNARAWAHGLFGGIIGAVAGSISTSVALPDVVNLSHNGLISMGKVAIVSAIIAATGYLKQSPLPTSSVTVSATVETK